jgi:hypothetical protein
VVIIMVNRVARGTKSLRTERLTHTPATHATM